MSEFGRLEKIDLREGWLSEAQHFTPWLAQEENLLLLGDALGLELELEAQERSVGPFRADILCKDTADGSWVLIENQLERTDHRHLGQLITYAAGLNAVTIIWIAAGFAEEHRAACDWLNEMTDKSVRIFGLEVELWRIGDSPVAPKFNVVSKPNDWSKSVAAAKKNIEEGDLSPLRQLQLKYWTEVEELIRKSPSPVNAVKPLAQSWMNHSIGKSGVSLTLSMNSRERRVRVAIALLNHSAKSRFSELARYREEIESRTGGPLVWYSIPENKEARISLDLENVDIDDESDWSRQHQWLAETAGRFHSIFKPYIMNLSRDDLTTDSDEMIK